MGLLFVSWNIRHGENGAGDIMLMNEILDIVAPSLPNYGFSSGMSKVPLVPS